MERLYEFEVNSERFLYSGHTGALVECTQELSNYLKNHNVNSEIHEILFSDSSYSFHIPDTLKLYSLTFFITNYCNLDCSYCYNKNNRLSTSERMNTDVFLNAVEYFLQHFSNEGYINIHFFGGEPLLYFEFIQQAVKGLKTIERIHDTKFTFSITTNGTIYSEQIEEFLLSNDFGVMMSIDGEKESHDKNRPFSSGKGSYDIVMKNMEKLSQHMGITARVTVTDEVVDFVGIYETLRKSGVGEILFEIESTDKSFEKEVGQFKSKLSKNLEYLADHVLKEIEETYTISATNFRNVLKRIHGRSRKSYPCTSGISRFSVTSCGDIYFCHRFNNLSEFSWGDIYSGIDFSKIRDFIEEHYFTKRNNGKCVECWAGILCGGDCYHTSYSANKSTTMTNDIHCFFIKEMIKNALKVYASLNDDQKQRLFNNYS